MDKQEATDFVIRGIQNHLTKGEIIDGLSQQLNAPPDVVQKFVNRVIAEHGLEPLVFTKSASYDFEEITQPPQTKDFSKTTGGGSSNLPFNDNHQYDQDNNFENIPLPKASEFQNPKLEQFILSRLTKSSKDSDVVMAVCEETGMNWKDAERLVARVRQKNQKKLVTRQNMLVIPLAVMALLAGLALLIASINEAYNMTIAVQSGQLSALNDVSRQIIWGMITGFILLLGGGAGLVWALRDQFS